MSKIIISEGGLNLNKKDLDYLLSGYASKNILTKVPKGFKEIKGATNHPRGCRWFSNGKSMFSGEREKVLVVVDKEEFERGMKK